MGRAEMLDFFYAKRGGDRLTFSVYECIMINIINL